MLLKTMIAGWVILAAVAATQADDSPPPVKLVDRGNTYILSNGFCTAVISKRTSDLTSLIYQGVELMGYDSGHNAGYWEQTPASPVATVTIDPATNHGERAEVSIKGTATGGVGGGTANVQMEVRYEMGLNDSGLYTYAIFSHDAKAGAGSIGESRYGAKLSGIFDWLSIDDQRNRLMPTAADWAAGTQLNMKEVRRLNTGTHKGEAEHKYDYSAYQFKIPAFGWSSTKNHIGLYFINPSVEYLSGGATKYELTGHLDANPGGAPTLLDYWRGTHYGGSNCRIPAGEEWSKVVGPIMIYLNSKGTPQEMFDDARATAQHEIQAWPYDWVQGVDYPHRDERGAVSGQLVLNDPQAASAKLPNLLVGLAFPDETSATQNRGRNDWQNDAKHYEFWVRGDEDGHFSIPKVRPGTYQLHAITDGVLGEFSQQPIEVKAGDKLDLGKLEWKPVRYGKMLWEIGIPDRQGSEFFKGNDYFHWGWYVEYAKLFPNDVHYEVGKSDFHKDWFFEQVPHDTTDNDTSGTGRGRATPWTITFDLPEEVHGKATLRLAICGVGARGLDVTVNDKPAGTVNLPFYNATINRDGIGGYWSERNLSFDAGLLHAGQNTLVLTIPAAGLTSGIIYDYLRLEVDDNAKPAE